jgi:hypothetical protein
LSIKSIGIKLSYRKVFTIDKMDLFSNPMVESAKRAMTDEQKEEYKKIGEYLYNSTDYKTLEVGSKVQEAKTEDILIYATAMLKSGGDPFDLTQRELEELRNIYGEKWYERFDLEEDQVPKPSIKVEQVQKQCRQQLRAMKRKKEKMARK